MVSFKDGQWKEFMFWNNLFQLLLSAPQRRSMERFIDLSKANRKSTSEKNELQLKLRTSLEHVFPERIRRARYRCIRSQ